MIVRVPKGWSHEEGFHPLEDMMFRNEHKRIDLDVERDGGMWHVSYSRDTTGRRKHHRLVGVGHRGSSDRKFLERKDALKYAHSLMKTL